MAERIAVSVRGTVQGVGFRPFVYRLAERHRLSGWVLNHSGGVDMEIEGAPEGLEALLADLRAEAPPLARIDALNVHSLLPTGSFGFEIRASSSRPSAFQLLPPDTAPCDDCLRELFDASDRRWHYPFINCTNCGPRFTVIQELPYDRPLTTMRGFTMCPDCAAEYADPRSRRFHAQPNACAACGPRIWLEAPAGTVWEPPGTQAPEGPVNAAEATSDAHLARAAGLLTQGQTVAIKGLGGFHLACDANSETAVRDLRERKRRAAKPFAVMFPDLPAVALACHVDSAEGALLTSRQRPIVLLAYRGGLARGVAPGLRDLGAMLPSTPLHELLLRQFGGPLVMTSGNLSEEPIVADNAEARQRLGGIASALLLHDRDIASRYDDSVTRVVAGSPTVVRRARGYAPQPVDLPFRAPHDVLACGAQLKSTFCLLKDRYAFVGQHIGDLENAHTLRHFGDTVALYQRLFNVHPTLVAHDLHPNYPSTTFALALEGVERVAVQHHHAHIVACLAEHGLLGPAIGVAYDGLGYGTDGHFWGGELLLADWRGFRRLGHLREAPMPGAAAAIRKPYRMAVGLLQAWLSGETELFAPFLESIDARELALLRSGLNAPLTSSCGRLFDAVAALLGVCREARYEGQAAMELQALADPAIEGTYPFDMRREPGEQGAATLIIDPAPTLAALYREHRLGEPLPAIAMRFHRSVAEWTATAARIAQEETGLRQVALAGGVFQNTLLLREVLRRLPEAVHPRQLPANDGGISFGQAVVAATRHMEEGACPS